MVPKRRTKEVSNGNKNVTRKAPDDLSSRRILAPTEKGLGVTDAQALFDFTLARTGDTLASRPSSYVGYTSCSVRAMMLS